MLLAGKPSSYSVSFPAAVTMRCPSRANAVTALVHQCLEATTVLKPGQRRQRLFPRTLLQLRPLSRSATPTTAVATYRRRAAWVGMDHCHIARCKVSL